MVGGILAKAKAAEEGGMSLFLVPKGQYVEVPERIGWFITIMKYKPISWLQNYAEEKGWKIEIREVSTIEEAVKLMLA